MLDANDPLERTWDAHGYDSAFSPGSANGGKDEHCVADPSRVAIVDVILGDTVQAAAAGFEVGEFPKGADDSCKHIVSLC